MILCFRYDPRRSASTYFVVYSSVLGMIHANHGADISEYLLGQLKEATTDIVRHGGCLGLGLAAMGTAREGGVLVLNLTQDCKPEV